MLELSMGALVFIVLSFFAGVGFVVVVLLVLWKKSSEVDRLLKGDWYSRGDDE